MYGNRIGLHERLRLRRLFCLLEIVRSSLTWLKREDPIPIRIMSTKAEDLLQHHKSVTTCFFKSHSLSNPDNYLGIVRHLVRFDVYDSGILQARPGQASARNLKLSEFSS